MLSQHGAEGRISLQTWVAPPYPGGARRTTPSSEPVDVRQSLVNQENLEDFPRRFPGVFQEFFGDFSRSFQGVFWEFFQDFPKYFGDFSRNFKFQE